MAFRGERFFIPHDTIATKEPAAFVEYSPVPRYRILLYFHFIQLRLDQHPPSILLSMKVMAVNQPPRRHIGCSLLFPRLPGHPHPDIASMFLYCQSQKGQVH
jgi:hypothetical protein